MPGKKRKQNSGMNKSELRKKYLKLRAEIEPEVRKEANAAICENLKKVDEFASSNFVASYISDGTEPDLKQFAMDMMEKGKKFCFPRHIEGSKSSEYEMAEAKDFDRDFELGAFNLLEPKMEMPGIPEEKFNEIIWLTPGVAFDKNGGRLGRGKAVYDRLLKRGSRLTIGVFYECQQIASAPMEEHDYRLDAVVTEKGIYRRK
jgi:5-formyltetrahydrofolate cyclo-ligase